MACVKKIKIKEIIILNVDFSIKLYFKYYFTRYFSFLMIFLVINRENVFINFSGWKAIKQQFKEYDVIYARKYAGSLNLF